MNYRWYAKPTALQGKSDAFIFDGDDSGTIDGKKCVLRIKNREEIVNNTDNEARLDIFVEYPDKISREVKVTADGRSNYTIVQEINQF